MFINGIECIRWHLVVKIMSVETRNIQRKMKSGVLEVKIGVCSMLGIGNIQMSKKWFFKETENLIVEKECVLFFF